jgi:hypothetical protein
MATNQTSSGLQNTLERLDEVNRNGIIAGEIDQNLMLLTALSTTVMLATNQIAPKEFYQWTRVYLQYVRDESGRMPQNIKGLLGAMETFVKEKGIDDELQNKEDFIVPQLAIGDDSDEEVDDPIQWTMMNDRMKAIKAAVHGDALHDESSTAIEDGGETAPEVNATLDITVNENDFDQLNSEFNSTPQNPILKSAAVNLNPNKPNQEMNLSGSDNDLPVDELTAAQQFSDLSDYDEAQEH